MSRATGKTTMVVDNAIQALFKEGNIFVPTKQHIIDSSKYKENVIEGLNYIVDPDWDKGRAQEELFKRILCRLRQEHGLDVVYNLHLDVSRRVITFEK